MSLDIILTLDKGKRLSLKVLRQDEDLALKQIDIIQVGKYTDDDCDRCVSKVSTQSKFVSSTMETRATWWLYDYTSIDKLYFTDVTIVCKS